MGYALDCTRIRRRSNHRWFDRELAAGLVLDATLEKKMKDNVGSQPDLCLYADWHGEILVLMWYKTF